jgi:hypothetical protein
LCPFFAPWSPAAIDRQPVGTGNAQICWSIVTLRQQEPVIPRVPDQPATRLDEALLEAGHRPRVDPHREHQPPAEIPEVARETFNYSWTSFARKR